MKNIYWLLIILVISLTVLAFEAFKPVSSCCPIQPPSIHYDDRGRCA